MYALLGIRLLICRIKYVVVAVIVWILDLQLPMQSVPITTDFVSSNLDQDKVFKIIW
jgi:hypothetical protein